MGKVDKNWVLSSEIKPELSTKDLSTLRKKCFQTIPHQESICKYCTYSTRYHHCEITILSNSKLNAGLNSSVVN